MPKLTTNDLPKFVFLILIGLLAIVEGFSQKLNPQEILENKDFLAEISFTVIRDKILIPVQIEGETFQFVLDTGGSLSISKAIQDKFQFKQTGSAKVIGINKLSKNVPYVRLPLVKIGDLRFKDYSGTVSDYSDFPYPCLNFDGIIGRDFLKGLVLQLDIAQQKMVLTDRPDRLSLDPADAIPLQLDRRTGLPYISVTLTPFGKENLVFDSGSDDLFSFKTSQVEKYSKQKRFKNHSFEVLYGVTSMGASGVIPAPSKSYRTPIREMQIGNHVITDFYSDISKKSRPRIGTRLLQYGLVTIDYGRQKFYFQAHQARQKGVEQVTSIGFIPRFLSGAYRVSAISPSSEAAQKGLKIGDEILQINQLDLRNPDQVDHCDLYLNGYKWEAFTTSTVVFKQGEEEKTITVKRIDY